MKYQDPVPYNPTHYRGWVYIVKSGKYYKIGFSRRHPQQRMSAFVTHNPYESKLTLYCETDQPRALEGYLHDKYRHRHHRNEWYRLTSGDLKEIILFLGAYGK